MSDTTVTTTPVMPLLKSLGLDERCVSVYVGLIRLGELPVSIIARRLGEKRTTTYYVLERLAEFGLLKVRTKRGVRCYQSCQPAALLQVLRRQRTRLIAGEQELMRWGEECVRKRK